MRLRPSLTLLALVSAAPLARAQVVDVRPVSPPGGDAALSTLRQQQMGFEAFRREHLPAWRAGRGGAGDCDEQVGRFCYWYDEREAPPPSEPGEIRDARERLIAALDSGARAFPGDRFATGSLVRYLAEAGRPGEAVASAERCADGAGWWCHALRGFALHAAARYAAADSAWSRALANMDERQRCEWRDLKLVLDDRLLRDYRTVDCAARERIERRVWWLSRPMLSSPGNDARTEYLSRRLYTEMLREAPSVHALGFDADERELLLRYGWPRAWSRSDGFLPGSRTQRIITGHEPTPAPPMLPTSASVSNPAFSDSVGWRGKGLPGVRARYSPEYARRLLPLTHQSAIFRRGDSALVVLAYDVSADTALAAAAREGRLFAGLVLTQGEEADAAIVRSPGSKVRGTMTARTTWAPMLMSAEMSDASRQVLARARYGMRASDTPGSRVSISDLLFYEPYDDVPGRLEQAIAHAHPSLVVRANAKLGIYWETYNTNPGGEGIKVDITVAPEQQDGSWLRRGLTALRLVREAQPVTVGITDVSERGAGYTPRAVVVDLDTLKPGRYVLQLEVTAEGTVPVRAERVLTVR